MGTIYLVRHGQARPDAYGIAVDSDSTESAPVGSLTSTGVAQAALTGTVLAEQVNGFTGAISGDLPRQTQTLAGVLDAFSSAPTPTVNTGWNEYETPSLMDNPSPEDFQDGRAFQQALDEGLGRWINGATPSDGGETYAQFVARVTDATDEAIRQAGSGQTLLVVSSAGVITQWIAQLFDVPAQRWPALARAMANASISKLIVGRSGVNLVSFNEHLHLSSRDGGISTLR